ncbi:hypothetical protein Acr_11g0005450 [Actinidia rufa]|uniref:Phorbol-ester/DAG-type domain-containing protein n=1 Tax=Actinidia rufa TaxID=165716 RepID=A0A7J0FDD2_9ERIC|nr:hypothetical protein Acr_11g0005450 [Actinidia rufa]
MGKTDLNIRCQYQHVAEMDVQKQLLEMDMEEQAMRDVQKQLLEDMEEQAMRDVHEQLKHPMIIAMKGHPCTGKSTIARLLADFLRYPLFAQDDSLDYARDKSFEAICRIAATQLSLRIRVIIDSSLTSQAHRDRLVQLAESTSARLIIVECRPSDEYEWRQRLERRAIVDQSYKPSTWGDLQKMLGKYEDYDVGAVSKLILDTTKVFREAGLVSATLRIAFYRNPHVLELDQWENLTMSWMKSKQSTEERGRYRHSHMAHILGLSNERKDTKATCNLCSELVSGQAYECDACEFILHKFCAELSDKVQRLPDECPPFLRAIPPVYTFSEKHASSTAVADAVSIFMSVAFCYHAHLSTELIETPSLSITFLQMMVRVSITAMLARENEKPSHWIYYCADHEFAAHMSCMTPEVRPYDMQIDKRLDILKM